MAARIELARAEDFPSIVALLQANELPVDGLRDHLASAFVARAGQRVVGSAALELYGWAAVLRSVAVEETLRSRGIGRALTQAALDHARQSGVRTAYLLTETASDSFGRRGFQPITRAEVAAAVQASVEFTTACPDTAQAMVLELASL